MIRFYMILVLSKGGIARVLDRHGDALPLKIRRNLKIAYIHLKEAQDYFYIKKGD